MRAALIFAGLNLAWEVGQLPLYTMWWTDPPGRIAFAVIHCTGGDVLIGAAALSGALLLAGRKWPRGRAAAVRVGLLATAFGLAYTVYSEWVNLVRGNWAYTEWMPVLPPFGTGLAPALQWILLSGLALYLAQRTPASRATRGTASPASKTQHVQ